jgi:hypothetical protein
VSVVLRAAAGEALARLDRRRRKRTSNQDWQKPVDPDKKITKMKEGARTSRTRRSTPWI